MNSLINCTGGLWSNQDLQERKIRECLEINKLEVKMEFYDTIKVLNHGH